MSGSATEPIRAFIAARPNPAAQAELIRIQRELKKSLAASGLRIKWTDPATFHITLLFLGDIPSARVDSVFQTLEQVCALTQSVRTFLSGLGLFKKSGALWVGIDASPALMALQKELAEALNMDPGRFHAHFTLGRIKAGRVDKDLLALSFGSFLLENAKSTFGIPQVQTLETCAVEGGKIEVEPVPFNIDSIELVQSELLQNGARHTVLFYLP